MVKLLGIFVSTGRLQFLASHSLLNSLIVGFSPHSTLKPSLVGVTNDLHMAESNGQASVFILLDSLAEWIQLFLQSSLIEFPHVCPKHHIFLSFPSYLACSSFSVSPLSAPPLAPDLSVGVLQGLILGHLLYLHSLSDFRYHI